MSKTVSKFALAASVVLAMAFTVSYADRGSSAFVGKWVTEDGSSAPSGLPDNLELFKDGTGIIEGMSISWKVVDKRFVISSSLKASAYNYEFFGKKFTLINDKGRKETYVTVAEAEAKKAKEAKAAREAIAQKAAKAVVQRGSFSDQRDGKTYKTVKIGSQTWMAENLNYDANSSKCYENKPENCAKYGRLYDWATAKSACSSGWHLPSKDEWQELVDFAGGDEVAGTLLKAKAGWAKTGNGTDQYGFSALPGGGGDSDGSFGYVGYLGGWWSATEDDSSYAYLRAMYNDVSGVGRNGYYKSNLLSVRCVQD